MTTDQKQKIRRDHAASTIRQLATVLRELGTNILDSQQRTYYQHGSIALLNLATKIEKGEINPRRWEFMTWIAEPKDLDSLELSAIFAANPSSG